MDSFKVLCSGSNFPKEIKEIEVKAHWRRKYAEARKIDCQACMKIKRIKIYGASLDTNIHKIPTKRRRNIMYTNLTALAQLVRLQMREREEGTEKKEEKKEEEEEEEAGEEEREERKGRVKRLKFITCNHIASMIPAAN